MTRSSRIRSVIGESLMNNDVREHMARRNVCSRHALAPCAYRPWRELHRKGSGVWSDGLSDRVRISEKPRRATAESLNETASNRPRRIINAATNRLRGGRRERKGGIERWKKDLNDATIRPRHKLCMSISRVKYLFTEALT